MPTKQPAPEPKYEFTHYTILYGVPVKLFNYHGQWVAARNEIFGIVAKRARSGDTALWKFERRLRVHYRTQTRNPFVTTVQLVPAIQWLEKYGAVETTPELVNAAVHAASPRAHTTPEEERYDITRNFLLEELHLNDIIGAVTKHITTPTMTPNTINLSNSKNTLSSQRKRKSADPKVVHIDGRPFVFMTRADAAQYFSKKLRQ